MGQLGVREMVRVAHTPSTSRMRNSHVPPICFSDHASLCDYDSYRCSLPPVQEKEEHLLPPPYQTNCRDNGPSKDAKNFTNPNSYEMCLEMCDSELAKNVFGCHTEMTMASSPSDFCLRIISKSILGERELMEKQKHLSCVQNCRPGCLNLHYSYQLDEMKHPQEVSLMDGFIMPRNAQGCYQGALNGLLSIRTDKLHLFITYGIYIDKFIPFSMNYSRVPVRSERYRRRCLEGQAGLTTDAVVLLLRRSVLTLPIVYTRHSSRSV
ncbi:hypothetical protein AVEN_83730-1 [Araneus ventricosus]|uniref:Uncharacterized protein n=1 Tax=Araneus ventricosus TaxID=182803 RepID=A0A4Y2EU61_ARAVE|nr:hypothetical protein AVEN_83730-1 [Araneus ventricosus]